MSNPTHPRSGRGGDLQMLDDKFPTPGDNFVTNPLLESNLYYLSRESLTIWPSMAIRVANAPTLGTSLGDESPTNPPAAQPGVGGV